MTTIGLDFVVIKDHRACLNDHRGCQSGFFWSDVQQVIEYVDVNSRATAVKVKFRNDHEGAYTLVFEMSMNEFLEQVEKQLGAGLPNPSYITPGQVTIEPLSNPYPDGPADQIVTWMKND